MGNILVFAVPSVDLFLYASEYGKPLSKPTRSSSDLSNLNLNSTYGDLCSSRCCKKYIFTNVSKDMSSGLPREKYARHRLLLAHRAKSPSVRNRPTHNRYTSDFPQHIQTSQSQEVNIHRAVTIAELPYLYVNSQLEK